MRIRGRVGDIHAFLRRFRGFVAPLRFGAGSKKKILDAMASGVPVVTTSVGAEGMGFRDGVDIMIADTPREFAVKTLALYRDTVLWRRISRAAYRSVQAYAVTDTTCDGLADMLEGNKDRRPPVSEEHR
jgi:glycosyltransferase involved in cell wall biosynthesis